MKVHILAFSTLVMIASSSLVSAQELTIISPSDRPATPVLELPAPPAEPVTVATEKPVLADRYEVSFEDSSMSVSTPEMWFYLQALKRYDDPQNARRRRAEQVAAERRARIAAQKWFGISKSRPQANPSPIIYQYRTSHATDIYRHTSTGNGRQF